MALIAQERTSLPNAKMKMAQKTQKIELVKRLRQWNRATPAGMTKMPATKDAPKAPAAGEQTRQERESDKDEIKPPDLGAILSQSPPLDREECGRQAPEGASRHGLYHLHEEHPALIIIRLGTCRS
jgi:hypothetical protein